MTTIEEPRLRPHSLAHVHWRTVRRYLAAEAVVLIGLAAAGLLAITLRGPLSFDGDAGLDVTPELCVLMLAVGAGAALARLAEAGVPTHGRYGALHNLRLQHEARAKVPRFDSWRWTADIEVNFIVPKVFPDSSSLAEQRRVISAELQRNWMLNGTKS